LRKSIFLQLITSTGTLVIGILALQEGQVGLTLAQLFKQFE
jgi:hypothetical protein